MDRFIRNRPAFCAVSAGSIGCFMAQLAKIRGAQKVIMLDLNDTRLEMAKDFDIDTTVNSASSRQMYIQTCTFGSLLLGNKSQV